MIHLAKFCLALSVSFCVSCVVRVSTLPQLFRQMVVEAGTGVRLTCFVLLCAAGFSSTACFLNGTDN